MRNLGIELLESLNLIKGNGSFVTSHSASFVFPGLTVQGLGEIAYPINPLQANALIKEAHKAPFGKGSQTIVDDTVRRAWEIDVEKLHFDGLGWEKFLQKALANIKPQLGIEDYEVEAHLYKMLIYEKGDFFLSHRDSEKEKGMFGTLIIGLPSRHNGGELLVRFDGEEQSIHFEEAANHHKIPYVAFYADCEHEIKPLTEGYRVCLVYNLVQKKPGKEIRLEPLGEYVSRLAAILKDGKESRRFSPGIVLLGHQYTPENFSKAHLKLNDRTRAEALMRAANAAGYYANLCLVTSYLSGAPASGGYEWDDELLEDAEMDEVYDESLYIGRWLDNGPPPLRNIQFEENDLLAGFRLNEGEPTVKETEGYMGNYGPDLMHWYHYGAVVIWPKEDHAERLLAQDTTNQLEWIGYYNTIRNQLSANETANCETILNLILHRDERSPKADYNVIADWLIGYHDDSCFDKLGYQLLQRYFQKINGESWIRLVEAYPVKHFEKIFKQVSREGNISDVWHLLSLFIMLSGTESGRALVASEMPALPEHFSSLATVQHQKPPVNAAALKNLLHLENMLPQDHGWVTGMNRILTCYNERGYVNDVLVPVILNLEKKTPLATSLLSFGRDHLQKRVSKKPQPPANWSRPVPDASRYARLWKFLEAFIQSPVEQVFDFRRNQQERSELESAIQSVDIDLRTETIKKGSPYTLRIIKTQAAYEKQMKEWLEDVALLAKVKEKQFS
ncbi:MAG: 2OG-Fe(II) oxygenase [Anditalea sp.]